MIISIANNKGGVSKTTIAQAIANGLNDAGLKVLAVDLDPQGNLSYSMGAEEVENTVFDLFNGTPASECITETAQTAIIASNSDLSSVSIDAPQTLENLLESVIETYDCIVIDTAPNLDMLSINALTASDYVIVPATADTFALQGLSQFAESVISIRNNYNPRLKIAGIVITQYRGHTILNRQLGEALEDVAEYLDTKVFNSRIRQAIAISEAQTMQVSIFDYQTQSKVVDDLSELIKEVIEVIS